MMMTAEQQAQRRLDRLLMTPTQRARWRARREAQLRQIAAHYRRLRGPRTASVDA
jgi:hypothetical protein